MYAALLSLSPDSQCSCTFPSHPEYDDSGQCPVVQLHPIKSCMDQRGCKQAGSVWRGPRVRLGRPIYTLLLLLRLPSSSARTCFRSLTLLPFSLTLGRTPTSLGILAGGPVSLRGWRGPRVSWRGTWRKFITHPYSNCEVVWRPVRAGKKRTPTPHKGQNEENPVETNSFLS